MTRFLGDMRLLETRGWITSRAGPDDPSHRRPVRPLSVGAPAGSVPGKKASSIDEYIRDLPSNRRPFFERLIALARRELRGFDEGFQYGMPYFRRDADTGVGLASRNDFVVIYAGDPVLSELRTDLARFDLGKGCVRIKRAEETDWAVLARLLRRAAK